MNNSYLKCVITYTCSYQSISVILYFVVQLKGTPRNRNFRGFLIQARTVGDDSPVGSFNSGTLHQQVCTNNVSLNMMTLHTYSKYCKLNFIIILASVPALSCRV